MSRALVGLVCFLLALGSATLAGCGQGSKRDTRALLVAAENGDMIRLKEAIANGSAPDDVQNVGDRTALLLAAMNGHSDVVAYLLEQGADPLAEFQGVPVKVGFRQFRALLESVHAKPEVTGTYRKQDDTVIDIRAVPYRPSEYDTILEMLEKAMAKAAAAK